MKQQNMLNEGAETNTPMISMNDEFEEKDTAQYIKSYMFLKGYAMGKGLNQTLMALTLAQKFHDGQYRKDGTPYFLHPLKVCSTLVSYGIDDDTTLAAALLHDVLEDCIDQLPMGGEELCSKYNLSTEILEIIQILTKESGLDDNALGVYFKRIEENPKAALIKLSDRLHNSSTLYTFTTAKMRKYIRETDMFLIPMASYCKKYYPAQTRAFAIMKSSIESMNRSMDIMLKRIENLENQLSQNDE